MIDLRSVQGKDTSLLHGAESLLDEDASDPTLSGKLAVLFRILESVATDTDEKVVIGSSLSTIPEFTVLTNQACTASNFTHTLDLVEEICRDKKYTYVRMDGSTQVKERQKIVETFNRTPQKQQCAFCIVIRIVFQLSLPGSRLPSQ